MRRARLVPALAAIVALGACAHGVVLPMTSAELAAHPGASALVAYLAQPDSDPEACASVAARRDDGEDLPAELAAALVEGKVPAAAWGACVERLLPRLDAPRAAALTEDMVRAAAALLADAREREAARRAAGLQVLARVYLERAPGGGASDEAARTLDEARRAATGPEALEAAGALAAGLELERGRWQGRPVDPAALDAMAADVGVALLLRTARRLPDPGLRGEAERLAVRQRIAASPFPEVRAAATGVEAAVLRDGTNPISLEVHRPVRASLAAALPARVVVVRQRPAQGEATLLGRAPDRQATSVLPPVPLRAVLQVEVAGLSRPVTLCGAGRALDPTPCIPAQEVTSGSPFAGVRDGGELRIAEEVAEPEAVALARSGSELRIPLRVGGVAAGAIEWPVAFERPSDIVLSGPRPGAPGPGLTVTVERIDPSHLVYRVDGANHPLWAVVEVRDARSFKVVSRGAPGANGRDGMDGTDGLPGMDGSDASCPAFDGRNGSRGDDGGDGSDGGNGSPGGRGGDVRVVVSARDQREESLELARASVASEGGPGGRGGRGGQGGRGGRGGSGGSGATCTDGEGHTTSLSGGLDGSSGRDGRSGMDGRGGPPGPPGVVRFELAPGPGA